MEQTPAPTVTSTVQRPPKNGQRLSRFVFTLNNWTAQEWAQLIETMKSTKWWIMGKEKAPVTGTSHLQGACVLGKQMALRTIKKLSGLERAHLEPMKGSPEQSRIYCTKDGDFVEWGRCPKQGERTDLQKVAQMVLGGATMRELALDPELSTMVIRYHRGLTALRTYVTPPRDPSTPPKVIWLYGPTGTSKTRTAVDATTRLYGCPPWISSGTLQWFDGYDGQPAVIIDDFRTGHCRFEFLLRVLDRYPFRAPIKGGMVEWNPSLIIVTCPYGPRRLWNLKTEEALDQLSRRITLEAAAPEEIPGVYELLCLENPELVVPVLQRGSTDNDGGDVQLSFRELYGVTDDNQDHYHEIEKE